MKYKVAQDTLHNYTVDERIHFARIGMDYEGDVGKLVLYAIKSMQDKIDELETELETCQNEYSWHDDNEIPEDALENIRKAIEILEGI